MVLALAHSFPGLIPVHYSLVYVRAVSMHSIQYYLYQPRLAGLATIYTWYDLHSVRILLHSSYWSSLILYSSNNTLTVQLRHSVRFGIVIKTMQQ